MDLAKTKEGQLCPKVWVVLQLKHESKDTQGRQGDVGPEVIGDSGENGLRTTLRPLKLHQLL